MLRANRPNAARSRARFAIVASRYNSRYVNGLIKAAQARLRAGGVPPPLLVRVPGAFEIPLAAAVVAREHRPLLAAVICLGVILRGETGHADYIGHAISSALARVQLDVGIPVIHEVLLLDNAQQAKVRCLGVKYNRGLEAANTALEMAALLRTLRGTGARLSEPQQPPG